MWGSILYFFVLTIGLGFIVDIIIKSWKADFFEKLVIRIGVGIASISVYGVILNLLHIPLDWIIFLFLAIITFSIAFYFRKQTILQDFKFNFSKITKNQIYSILILIMFTITAYMYINGSFAYPWFEDGDPYGYALASKYIAEEKTYSTPFHFSHYAEPYTQGYQIFMGILHQTNDSIYWNMKFFNALVISLSILFFFYFAKSFTKNRDIALISTFALFAIPCWVGHFVFSLNFNMSIFPVFLYTLSNMRNNKIWKYILSIILASLLINHTNTAVTIMMLFIIYYLNKVFVEADLNKELIQAGFFGFMLSLLFYLPSYIKHSEFFFDPIAGTGGLNVIFEILHKIISSPAYLMASLIILVIIITLYFKKNAWFKYIKKGLQINNIKHILFFAILVIIFLILIIPSEKFINIKGTGTRDYTFSDFFVAQKGNMTNNPIGVGLVLMILFSVGLLLIVINYKKLFKKENFWVSTTFIWIIFSLIIIFGTYFSIMYIPFRMWTFFAIFASLIIGFSVINLLKLIKNKPIKFIVLLLFIILVIPTSFSQKYWHNTAIWPEHQVFVIESQQFYVWLRDNGRIPKDSAVYPLCHYPSTLYGYDMNPMTWQNEELSEDSEKAYYLTSLNKTLEDNYQFLKRNQMDYVVLGASCVAKHKFDVDLVTKKINEMANSSNFNLIHSTQSEFLFKVN